MNPRIQRVRSILKEKRLDALLVTKEVNVSYLTGLSIADTYLLLTKDKNIILTDFRYLSKVKSLKDFILEKANTSILDTVVASIKKLNLRRIGFEGDALAYNTVLKIKKGLKGKNLVNTNGIIEQLRMIKNPEELKAIKEAIKISKSAFSYIKKILKAGISEKTLARKIDVYIRSHGAEGVAFPTIVASGPNSAKPHAHPTARRIRRNEPIVIDVGVRYKGYNSDLTRTFSLGKMGTRFYDIYNLIVKAQKRAIASIGPNKIASKVDQVARDVIGREGFSERFGHALGHGIGREVHESPKIFKTTKSRLLPNMVLTIEPAIYITGWGGVRIEDMVVVTNKGCKVLTDDIDKSI